MKLIKKCCFFIIIVLFLTSIYKDLHLNITGIHDMDRASDTVINNTEVIKIKVKEGETVLSITEKINHFEKEQINIKQIMLDFEEANPNVNPYRLKANRFYYFPLYSK